MTEPAEPLLPLDESWERALCVVAHPDDLEYGAAAAVARWTAQGKQVVYCMVSSGEAGIDAMSPEQAKPLREQEERDSAAAVGVRDVEFLGLPDGMLEYGVALRREIAAVMRRHRPEIVVTLNFRESFGGAWLNQADHIAVGRAALDAVRDAGNRWLFPEQLGDGLEPWNGVHAVVASGSPYARHGVDVGGAAFEAGVASLEAHRAYIDGLGRGDFSARGFLEDSARRFGARMGVELAASFERFPMAPDE